MKFCAYCGNSNLDTATTCSKCGTSLESFTPIEVKAYRFGPNKAWELRHKAIGYFLLGLMIKIYWGGYGTWPVYDNDFLMSIRPWAEPVFLYGGAAAYILGWILRWI
jgi:zinc-ribbon domain